MFTKKMAVSTVGISCRARSLNKSPHPCGSSWPCTYQPRHLSLQNSRSTITPHKSLIKSMALHEKLVPVQADHSTKSLEQVKTIIKKALQYSTDPTATLQMIDTIQRLGIPHHFEEEINNLLTGVWDWDAGEDLSATALHFRLLRHDGRPACSDVFKKFMDKRGNFKESLTKDTCGMLSLYEASHLGAEGEEILVQAMHFARAHLHQSIPHVGPEVSSHVAEALSLPRHLRMRRLEARNYIDEYSRATNHIPALVELAKWDFDMVQSLHQRELAEICRWWKELGLVDKLGFARDRPSECFLWTVGIFPEQRYSNCRIELTKTICILLVMDDIFDTYGSLDELVLFTEAIRRWDLEAMEQLPGYMKICYMALYNTTNEIAYRVQKQHGFTVVAHLKSTWIDIFEAFLEEAKWFNSGYIPKFKEYLDNGVTSAGSYMALVHALFLIGDGLSKETIFMMKPYPRLFSCSGQILRLWDDLGTSREEQERGDNACSIQCHMRERNVSDEDEARKYIRQLIGKSWLELNGLAMASTSLPSSIIKASLDMARTAQIIYQHGDDKSASSVEDYVQKLLFKPFSTDEMLLIGRS